MPFGESDSKAVVEKYAANISLPRVNNPRSSVYIRGVENLVALRPWYSTIAVTGQPDQAEISRSCYRILQHLTRRLRYLLVNNDLFIDPVGYSRP
jgi:hypothetical protein